MPETLVIVRHGLSEPNIIQRLENYEEQKKFTYDLESGNFEVNDPTVNEFVTKYAGYYAMKDEIYARPDFAQRLSLEGVEQAKKAGAWLRDNFIKPEDFDERYVSPFNRTMETAMALGGSACEWLVDWRIVERDWGIYGATPKNIRSDMFPHTDKNKELASFFTRYENGESILDTVLRVRDWTDTLVRDNAGKKVLATSHGELMWAERVNIERILPQEFHELDNDKSLRIGNCCLLIYDRNNPDGSGEMTESLSSGWMRMIDPVEPEKSPYGGEWQRLPGKRRFSNNQLSELFNQTPRLIV